MVRWHLAHRQGGSKSPFVGSQTWAGSGVERCDSILDPLRMHIKHGVERHQGLAIVEKANTLVPDAVEIQPFDIAGPCDVAQVVLGTADEEVPIWHATIFEALRIQQGCSAAFIAIAAVVRDGALAWRRCRNVRSYRGDPERARFNGNVAAPRLQTATQILVWELILQVIIPLNAALGGVVADPRLDAKSVLRIDRRAICALLLMHLVVNLRMLHIPVILEVLLDDASLLDSAVVFDIPVQDALGAGTLLRLSLTEAKPELLVACLVWPAVVSRNALTGIEVVVRIPVHLPVCLSVRL
mmetsp:Transcript_33944/g.79002  ORF Transcript_33944/g.79002 Transcript_33944/m.79002 type:complete len:298 (-) Transcript_33944:680-1573(-)